MEKNAGGEEEKKIETFDALEAVEGKSDETSFMPQKIKMTLSKRTTSRADSFTSPSPFENEYNGEKARMNNTRIASSKDRTASLRKMLSTSSSRVSSRTAKRITSGRNSAFDMPSSKMSKRILSKSSHRRGKRNSISLHNDFGMRKSFDAYFSTTGKRDRALRNLGSFLPGSLCQKLVDTARSHSDSITPQAHTDFSIVMLADVSGFTKLGERLCAKGSEGVDELSSTINVYFGELIEIVKAHGGDILNFAGDALIIKWIAGDAKRESALLALQCGVALANLEKMGLTVHVGIGCGELTMMTCGGYDDLWCYLAVGSPLMEASLAEGASKSKEVVVSGSLLDLILDNVAGELVGEHGCFRVNELRNMEPATRGAEAAATAAGPMEGVLRRVKENKVDPGKLAMAFSYFLPPTVSAIMEGDGSYMNELRAITVTFTMLGGFSMPLSGDFSSDEKTSAVLDMVHQPLKELQRVLAEHGGMLRQFILDDKGCVLIGCWGLPGFVHDNSAERATAYALELRTVAASFGLTTATGITSGSAFCGGVGSSDRREYAMVGKVVNLSARMMVHSAKKRALSNVMSITMDLATSAPIKPFYTLQKSGPVTFKGIPEPIMVYHPVAAAKRQVKVVKMVGRQKERDIIVGALKDLLTKDVSSALSVEGPAGLGKSTLVNHARSFLKKKATSGEVVEVYSRGLRTEMHTPYFAFNQILATLVGFDSSAPEDAQRALISSLIEVVCANDRPLALELSEEKIEAHKRLSVFPIFKTAFRLKWSVVHDVAGSKDHNHETAAYTSGQTRWVMLELLRYGVGTHKVPRHAYIVEDAHFIDASSWSMIEELWHAVTGASHVNCVVLLTARPDEVAEAAYASFASLTAMSPVVLTAMNRGRSLSCSPTLLRANRGQTMRSSTSWSTRTGTRL